MTDAQQLQKEHEDALETSGDDQVKALEDAISRGNDEIKECRDSTKEAMKALATQEKQVKAAQRVEKQQRDLLAGPSLGVPLYAIDATRGHLTMKWVFFLLILGPFGPRSTGDAPRRCKGLLELRDHRRATPCLSMTWKKVLED